MEAKAKIPSWPTEMVKLTENTYAYIQTAGTLGLSNAGLIVVKDHAVLIDTLNSETAAKAFFTAVSQVTKKKVKYILITHSHPDHIWGNHLMPEAAIICHAQCYSEIEKMGRLNTEENKRILTGDFSQVFSSLPEITFDNNLFLNLADKKVQLLHFGFAHTQGDIAIYIPEEEVVFCGDLLFLYSTPMGFGGFFPGWIEALTKIAELPARVYVPGHGPVCDRKALLKCRDYLILVYDSAKKYFKTGLSYREAAARVSLGEFNAWAEPERVIGNMAAIYRELNGQNLKDGVDMPAMIAEMKEFKSSMAKG
jgi:cyclase